MRVRRTHRIDEPWCWLHSRPCKSIHNANRCRLTLQKNGVSSIACIFRLMAKHRFVAKHTINNQHALLTHHRPDCSMMQHGHGILSWMQACRCDNKTRLAGITQAIQEKPTTRLAHTKQRNCNKCSGQGHHQPAMDDPGGIAPTAYWSTPICPNPAMTPPSGIAPPPAAPSIPGCWKLDGELTRPVRTFHIISHKNGGKQKS